MLRQDNEAGTRNHKDNALNIVSLLRKDDKEISSKLNLFAPDTASGNDP